MHPMPRIIPRANDAALGGAVFDESTTSALIELDSSIYGEDVVLKAAYWLTDRCYVHVCKSEAGKLAVEIRLKDDSRASLASVCGEFCNSLVDFAVRAHVARETEIVQEALLRRAFVELAPKANC
jgi:His-Xaa-Ser system protein HxsD